MLCNERPIFGRWARVIRQPRELHKPFTPAELTAKLNAETYLDLARSYRNHKDVLNAVISCLEGQQSTIGFSRPLMVRDQLHDLLRQLDPDGTTTARIRALMK